MTKYYFLAFFLLFIPLCAILVRQRDKGRARFWLQKIPMPILVIVLVWLCNELIFIDRTLGWLWVQERYCANSGAVIKRKIPKNAFMVLEPASVDPGDGYQTLERWIRNLPLPYDYSGEFAIDVVSPMVMISPKFPGDISSMTALTWKGKSAKGVCLHMYRNGNKVDVLSECGNLLSDLKRPIVRVKREVSIGLDGLGIFNIERDTLSIYDRSGPFVDVVDYRYGGGWLAKTIPPGEDSFGGKVTYPMGSYFCIKEHKLFSVNYWFNKFSE